MLPWLIGAAVVAGVGYMASGSDSSDDDDDYERAERRRERARRREREEERNRENLKSEIDDFESLSKRQINDKYGIKILFNGANVKRQDDSNSKITHFKNSIKKFEKENSEIQTLISDLQKAKDAV